jgi:lipoate-protein ligase A
LAQRSCTKTFEDASEDPKDQLALDWALFTALETGAGGDLGRSWQTNRPAVVVGRHAVLLREIVDAACRRDGVPVIRRFSGGGAVVLGPGCLNYGIGLSLASRPGLASVADSFAFVLRAIVSALDVPGLSIAGGSDLVLDGRKVSGSAQRRGRRAMLHHGTLLYDFDPALAARYLREPVRQPAYRASRRHTDFLGNLPLPADAIHARLETAWRTLGAMPEVSSDVPAGLLRQDADGPAGSTRNDRTGIPRP